MARGTSLLELVQMLRNELGRSTSVAVGVDDLPRLKYQINKAYARLFDKYDWPHLQQEPVKIELAAGQRYYDLPATLDFDRIGEIRIQWNARPHIATRGISLDDFNSWDSNADERSSPVLKWDVRRVVGGTAEQIEVWPIPADNEQEIHFIGTASAPRLVRDEDLCLIDDYLVVLDAAAATATKKEDKQIFKAEMADRLTDLRANAANNFEPIRLGLPSDRTTDYKHVIVRVR